MQTRHRRRFGEGGRTARFTAVVVVVAAAVVAGGRVGHHRRVVVVLHRGSFVLDGVRSVVGRRRGRRRVVGVEVAASGVAVGHAVRGAAGAQVVTAAERSAAAGDVVGVGRVVVEGFRVVGTVASFVLLEQL